MPFFSINTPISVDDCSYSYPSTMIWMIAPMDYKMPKLSMNLCIKLCMNAFEQVYANIFQYILDRLTSIEKINK